MMKKQQTQGWQQIFHHPTRISKLSKPLVVVTLAGATLFAGCSKDDKKDEIVPQHDTVYTFAPNTYDNLKNLEQIKRSADSVEVRTIIFRVINGNYGWNGINFKALLSIFQQAFDAAQGKGEGDGVFKNVTDNNTIRSVEPEYNKLGYKFEYYHELEQAMQRPHK